MASSSTVSEARSALLNAVAATDSLIELERDGEQRARALAGREAMVDLCDQLSLLEDNAIMAEVALRVPPAISWLPHAVQGILASKVSLGQAIIEAARQTGNDASRFGDAHLVQLANLNEAVRQRSSSPRVDIFAEAARPQRRSPVSRPKPIIEPPVPAQHFSISSGPMSEDEVVPAPAGFLVGAQDDANAKDAGEVRVPSTGTLDSRSTSSVVLRRRAEVARRRAAAAAASTAAAAALAEQAALELAAEEAELIADEASSRRSQASLSQSRTGDRQATALPREVPLKSIGHASLDKHFLNVPAIEPKSMKVPLASSSVDLGPGSAGALPDFGPTRVLADGGSLIYGPSATLPPDASNVHNASPSVDLGPGRSRASPGLAL